MCHNAEPETALAAGPLIHALNLTSLRPDPKKALAYAQKQIRPFIHVRSALFFEHALRLNVESSTSISSTSLK